MSEETKNPLEDFPDKPGIKITFGLQPNHIEKVESELARWDAMLEEGDSLEPGWRKYDKYFWDKLGVEFGWCPFTLALYYFRYLEKNKTK